MGGGRRRHGAAAFEALGTSLTPVQTPVGDAWILASDEAAIRAGAGPGRRPAASQRRCLSPAARSDRDLMVPDADRRSALWTPRVWPGGLLVAGEIAGTWRRADTVLTVQPWWPLSRAERDAVAAEAESLPCQAQGFRPPKPGRYERPAADVRGGYANGHVPTGVGPRLRVTTPGT